MILQSLISNAYNVKNLKNICKKLEVKVCSKKNELADSTFTIINPLNDVSKKV
jgi:hypothetical protein